MAKLKVVGGSVKEASAPVKGAKKEAKAKVAKETVPKKFAGKTTGKGVREFQNDLFAANFKAHLSDEELATAMRDEFPNAVPYTVEHVRGIRSAFNKGKHGNTAPGKPLPEYDEAGNAQPLWGEKSAARKAAAEAKAEEAAPAKKLKKKTA